MWSFRIIAVLGVVAALYFASVILIPLVLGLFMFLILDPLVVWGENRKISRTLLSPVLVVLSLGVATAVCWSGYIAAMKIIDKAPQYSVRLNGLFAGLEKKAKSFQLSTGKIFPKTPEAHGVQRVEVVQGPPDWTSFVLRGLGSAVGIITSFFLIPILALLLLLEKPLLKDRFVEWLGPGFRSDLIGFEITQMVKGFFLGNLVVGLGTGVCFLVVFSLLKLDNSFPLAFAAGFLNLIPIAGAILSVIFPLAGALLQFDVATPFIIILVTSVFLHFFVANFVLPKVIGPRINVNSVAATIGLIFWGWIWGAIGLVLAIPLTAVVRIFLSSHESGRRLAGLVSESHEEMHSRLWVPPKPEFKKAG